MSLPFSLIEVHVGGEAVQARPTLYSTEEHDGTGLMDNGEYMVPTRFMTTCPKCIQLIEFDPMQIYILEGSKNLNIDCECGATSKGKRISDTGELLFNLRSIDPHVYSIIAEAWKVNQTAIKEFVPAASAALTNLGPLFVDPIESGRFAVVGLVRLGA